MLFNLYGSAVLFLLADLGILVNLVGGIGVTGSSSIDGWLIIVALAPFFGYLIDRSEHRGLLKSYWVLTSGFFKSININYPPMPPWQRLACFGAPVVLYPWIGIVFGTYHWGINSGTPDASTPARFTVVCLGVAILSTLFGWFTRDYRVISPGKSESPEPMDADSGKRPEGAPKSSPPTASGRVGIALLLIAANVLFGAIFLVLIMIT